MAARAELIQMCKELELKNYSKLKVIDLKKIVRKTADKRFDKTYPIAGDILSETLRKFLNLEYDYVFKDQENNTLNWKGEKQ